MKREPNPYASNPILTVTNTMSISVPSMVAEDVIDGSADKIVGVDPAALDAIKETIQEVSIVAALARSEAGDLQGTVESIKDDIDSTSRLAYGIQAGYTKHPSNAKLTVDTSDLTGLAYFRLTGNGHDVAVSTQDLQNLVDGNVGSGGSGAGVVTLGPDVNSASLSVEGDTMVFGVSSGGGTSGTNLGYYKIAATGFVHAYNPKLQMRLQSNSSGQVSLKLTSDNGGTWHSITPGGSSGSTSNPDTEFVHGSISYYDPALVFESENSSSWSHINNSRDYRSSAGVAILLGDAPNNNSNLVYPLITPGIINAANRNCRLTWVDTTNKGGGSAIWDLQYTTDGGRNWNSLGSGSGSGGGAETVRYTGNRYPYLALHLNSSGALSFVRPDGDPIDNIRAKAITNADTDCYLAIGVYDRTLAFFNGNKTVTIVDGNGNLVGGSGSSGSSSSDSASSTVTFGPFGSSDQYELSLALNEYRTDYASAIVELRSNYSSIDAALGAYLAAPPANDSRYDYGVTMAVSGMGTLVFKRNSDIVKYDLNNLGSSNSSSGGSSGGANIDSDVKFTLDKVSTAGVPYSEYAMWVTELAYTITPRDAETNDVYPIAAKGFKCPYDARTAVFWKNTENSYKLQLTKDGGQTWTDLGGGSTTVTTTSSGISFIPGQDSWPQLAIDHSSKKYINFVTQTDSGSSFDTGLEYGLQVALAAFDNSDVKLRLSGSSASPKLQVRKGYNKDWEDFAMSGGSSTGGSSDVAKYLQYDYEGSGVKVLAGSWGGNTPILNWAVETLDGGSYTRSGVDVLMGNAIATYLKADNYMRQSYINGKIVPVLTNGQLSWSYWNGYEWLPASGDGLTDLQLAILSGNNTGKIKVIAGSTVSQVNDSSSGVVTLHTTFSGASVSGVNVLLNTGLAAGRNIDSNKDSWRVTGGIRPVISEDTHSLSWEYRDVKYDGWRAISSEGSGGTTNVVTTTSLGVSFVPFNNGYMGYNQLVIDQSSGNCISFATQSTNGNVEATGLEYGLQVALAAFDDPTVKLRLSSNGTSPKLQVLKGWNSDWEDFAVSGSSSDSIIKFYYNNLSSRSLKHSDLDSKSESSGYAFINEEAGGTSCVYSLITPGLINAGNSDYRLGWINLGSAEYELKQTTDGGQTWSSLGGGSSGGLSLPLVKPDGDLLDSAIRPLIESGVPQPLVGINWAGYDPDNMLIPKASGMRVLISNPIACYNWDTSPEDGGSATISGRVRPITLSNSSLAWHCDRFHDGNNDNKWSLYDTAVVAKGGKTIMNVDTTRLNGNYYIQNWHAYSLNTAARAEYEGSGMGVLVANAIATFDGVTTSSDHPNEPYNVTGGVRFVKLEDSTVKVQHYDVSSEGVDRAWKESEFVATRLRDRSNGLGLSLHSNILMSADKQSQIISISTMQWLYQNADKLAALIS